MYCQRCGAENGDDSKFCCKCAQPLTSGSLAESNKRENSKLLYSANVLNIISAVVIVLSIMLVAYGVSTANGSFSNSVSTNGTLTSSTQGSFSADTSGASLAYTACALDAVVVLIGFALYFSKEKENKKGMAIFYMIGACAVTCVLFFAGVRTISFTCGLGFIMTVAGILQIVAGSKFISATKDA